MGIRNRNISDGALYTGGGVTLSKMLYATVTTATIGTATTTVTYTLAGNATPTFCIITPTSTGTIYQAGAFGSNTTVFIASAANTTAQLTFFG